MVIDDKRQLAERFRQIRLDLPSRSLL